MAQEGWTYHGRPCATLSKARKRAISCTLTACGRSALLAYT